MKEIKTKTVKLRINDYQSNLEIYFWGHVFTGEADGCINVYKDACYNSTTERNIEDFIEALSEDVTLTSEDIEKLKEELQLYFYPFSSEIRG